MPIVFLTADHSVTTAQDRRMLQESKLWVEQMIRQDSGRFAHHHVSFPRGRRRSPQIREAMVGGFVRAAEIASGEPVMLMVAHGTAVNVDLAPPPHWRVDTNELASALGFINDNARAVAHNRAPRAASHDSEVGSLSLLRDALMQPRTTLSRIRQLDLFCCECGSGRDLVRRLGLVLRIASLRAVNGYVITLPLQAQDVTADQARRTEPRSRRAIGLGNFSAPSLGQHGVRHLRECSLPTDRWVPVRVDLPPFPPPD